jgi:hypothetical protein
MAKFAGFTIFLCTVLLGFMYGSHLILLITDGWFIREALGSDYTEYDWNTILRDYMTILIATCLAALVYTCIKQQFQTMLKWLVALCLFVTCIAISCIFADRAKPEGIVIDQHYYRWEDVAYVELYLNSSSYVAENRPGELNYDYSWTEAEIPNDDFGYTLVMRNGACINVFNWLQLPQLVELDRHVRKSGIKVVNGREFTSGDVTRLEEFYQNNGEFVKIEQGETIKVIYEKSEYTYKEEYREANIDSEYKEKYAAIFTGTSWYQSPLTAKQRQMLKSIFTR